MLSLALSGGIAIALFVAISGLTRLELSLAWDARCVIV